MMQHIGTLLCKGTGSKELLSVNTVAGSNSVNPQEVLVEDLSQLLQ